MGFDVPELPQPTPTQAVYETYTRTVTWTYWYTYYIYIEVRRTTEITSERRTISRVVSVSATASAEAERELRSIAEEFSSQTPVQATTEVRGPTLPPFTTASEEPEPTTFEIPEPTTRSPESDLRGSRGARPSGRSNTPPPRSNRQRPTSNTLPDVELPEPTANGADTDTTLRSGGASAAVSRFEGLSGVGSGAMAVTSLLALVVVML
ncbi:uncharacterized protein DFL_003109 [Arthrobotrys flagrans]|uniref:Uncharacterized protein n=1 Tax=Arthrobotrys flagrans TaxID=97331 RepID=A0A437ACF2_ARTFL|nr:hypothetical protein DFL_003109 [Arthrobotrys flagrans]